MEAGKSLFCSSAPLPPRTHHRSVLPSFSSPSSTSVTFKSPNFAARNSPTSVSLKEQRKEYKILLGMYKADKTSQATLNTRQMDMASVDEENNLGSVDHLAHDFRQQLHLWPHLQNLLPSLQTEEVAASSMLLPVTDSEKIVDSKQPVSVAEGLKLTKTDDDDSLHLLLGSTSLADSSLGRIKTVRSTRLLERQSRKRKVPKSKFQGSESYIAKKADAQGRLHAEKKKNKGFDQNDPLRLFLRGAGTQQRLTLEEEFQLITRLQDLLRLEKVKSRLQSQFGRKPTLAEWAEGVGLSCQVLQTQLHSGKTSREKLINAHLRMVVHIAKHYQGRGLSLQDLLQEGSMGLIRSVEKFKAQADCRFGSYAYWWIRQTIRMAIFQHSRTLRLPVNVATDLGKVMKAKKLYIQEGNLHPTKEELTRRVGVTVDQLEKLLFAARIPLSMQQTVWADEDTTFQEITADPAIETPELSVTKQMMRRHVRNLLSILTPKERRLIRLRFGMEDGQPKTLSGIGEVFGVGKERARQLESRALCKLKRCLVSQGLDAFTAVWGEIRRITPSNCQESFMAMNDSNTSHSANQQQQQQSCDPCKSFGQKCSHLVKKQRAKFYILRRCIAMLLCWHERGEH
ncbi:hypothetical protein L6164_009762 [Bauhinia variegata]|uniref:Uncharacterized protein n=1 Tax=Bauhinia variegata TaxID=167791 RepID=A0ACB9PNN7_BAUVA|nr:hypothetical protein L6164_009762 [Bauhinia variegata]